jgi:PleD family two-component response regulator
MGISVGVAELRPDQAPDDLLAAADQALLAAKAARDQPRRPGWRFGRTQARGGSRR